MREDCMDDIVKQAMAKWPNVPHCYGWLALDARGGWRMRDELAQRTGHPGERLTNAALVGFINRNYLSDERGCWYFQNGPQRVFVQLEATPFISRTDPVCGFLLQTGAPLAGVERAWLTDEGALIVQAGEVIAQVDDRDMAPLLAGLELDGKPVSDEALMAWLERGEGALVLDWRVQRIPVERIVHQDVAQRFGFTRTPAP
jgi:hypothetical protein